MKVSKLYWKIFIGFWLTCMLVLLGTNLIIHGLDLGPEKHFGPRYEGHSRPSAVRMLNYAVRDTINHTEREVIKQIRTVPHWAIRYLYVVDQDNEDVLGRRLPEGVKMAISQLAPDHPSERLQVGEATYYGRYLVLADGKVLRLIVTSHPEESRVLWQLFIIKFLPIFLVAVCISGTLCYLLARYMTRPIQTLKTATQRIASGDFSVRVVPEFGGRHNDITELGQAFDHMTSRLQDAMAEQRRLIKDVSHELRSPLMRLQFALGLAQQRSNGNVDEELKRIKEAADYLNDIISDILSVPINENENWEMNDVVDLKVLLETLLDDYKCPADKKQVRLCLDCFNEALVATHGNTLVGVFENLLNNALQYTEPNSDIRISVQQQAGKILVEVCDQGPGLPEDQLESIFKPFFRTDEARDRTCGGYGLGLAIAQRTVSLHNGTITARNRAEGGLCVTVTLPAGTFE